MIDKIFLEYDINRRGELIKEFLREMAQRMYEVPVDATHPGYSLNWPAVKNYGVYTRGGEVWPHVREMHFWLDQKKRPFGKES
jgi:hypothetical protein